MATDKAKRVYGRVKESDVLITETYHGEFHSTTWFIAKWLAF